MGLYSKCDLRTVNNPPPTTYFNKKKRPEIWLSLFHIIVVLCESRLISSCYGWSHLVIRHWPLRKEMIIFINGNSSLRWPVPTTVIDRCRGLVNPSRPATLDLENDRVAHFSLLGTEQNKITVPGAPQPGDDDDDAGEKFCYIDTRASERPPPSPPPFDGRKKWGENERRADTMKKKRTGFGSAPQHIMGEYSWSGSWVADWLADVGGDDDDDDV